MAFSILCLVGCKSDPPVVNVNAVPAGPGQTFAAAYEINEGSSLDLVVYPDDPTAMITTTTLPKNASVNNGVFSFTPDYSQAGLYNITFTITAGKTVTTKTIGIRVFNVIHVSPPPITQVDEGSAAGDITFSSDDPQGTVVTYSADLSNAPGATFDPVAAKLSFSPSWRWLDSKPAEVAIIVTAEGQEVDTGKVDTSTAKVVYKVNEATSFNQELVPLFLLPIGATAGKNPEYESAEAHDCVFCHDGSSSSPAGMDFHPTKIYSQLVNVDIALDGINGSTCHSQAALGWKRVVPNDLTKSLWFMKISGTDGAGHSGPVCGVQMPEQLPWWYLTVTDQDAWNACPVVTTENTCHEALNCGGTDIQCNLNARYVRKAALWIMAGAPNN